MLVRVLALAGSLLAVADASAGAGATSTFGGFTLNQTGFVFSGGPIPVVLGAGESQDFTINYTVSVHDDGLPAPFDPKFTGCLPIHDSSCNPPYTGYEVARVLFDVAYRDGRVANPFITLISDTGTSVNLQTHGDSFAESLSQSGTIHYRLTNISQFVQTDNFFPFVAAWVLAVPEPTIFIQLALGLGLIGTLRASASHRTPSTDCAERAVSEA
jgi:hypothetical protein